MKNIFLALLTLVSFSAFADVKPAPVLRDLPVQDIRSEAKVLETQTWKDAVRYTIGIEAKVSTGSVCTSFVGQESEKLPTGETVIHAKGASSALVQPCIEIFPMPVDTILTHTMTINPLLPVAEANDYVRLNGVVYQVKLDLHTQKVTLTQTDKF